MEGRLGWGGGPGPRFLEEQGALLERVPGSLHSRDPHGAPSTDDLAVPGSSSRCPLPSSSQAGAGAPASSLQWSCPYPTGRGGRCRRRHPWTPAVTRSPALFRGGLPAERGPRGSPPPSPPRLPPPAPLPPPARGSESAAGAPTAGSRPLPASAAGSAGCRVPRAGSSQLRWAPPASPPPSPGTWRLQLGACTALCDRLGTGCCSPLGSRCRSVARVWPRSPPCSLTRQELAGAQAAEPRPRALGEPVPGAGGSHLRVQRVRPALCPPPTDATSVRRGPEAPTPQMQKPRLQVVGAGARACHQDPVLGTRLCSWWPVSTHRCALLPLAFLSWRQVRTSVCPPAVPPPGEQGRNPRLCRPQPHLADRPRAAGPQSRADPDRALGRLRVAGPGCLCGALPGPRVEGHGSVSLGPLSPQASLGQGSTDRRTDKLLDGRLADVQ